jgi:hypothetical protein
VNYTVNLKGFGGVWIGKLSLADLVIACLTTSASKGKRKEVFMALLLKVWMAAVFGSLMIYYGIHLVIEIKEAVAITRHRSDEQKP